METIFKKGDRVIVSDPDISVRSGVIHMDIGQPGVSVLLDSGQRATIKREHLQKDEPAKKSPRRGRPPKNKDAEPVKRQEPAQKQPEGDEKAPEGDEKAPEVSVEAPEQEDTLRARYDVLMNNLTVYEFVQVEAWMAEDVEGLRAALYRRQAAPRREESAC